MTLAPVLEPETRTVAHGRRQDRDLDLVAVLRLREKTSVNRFC